MCRDAIAPGDVACRLARLHHDEVLVPFAIQQALDRGGVNAIVRFPPSPSDVQPPMVLENPWWARPFELFAGMIGTPSGDEADPSRLLAVLVPLMFGYMFGDVGHGATIAVAALALRHKLGRFTTFAVIAGLSSTTGIE